jgi:hypothetical protein
VAIGRKDDPRRTLAFRTDAPVAQTINQDPVGQSSNQSIKTCWGSQVSKLTEF